MEQSPCGRSGEQRADKMFVFKTLIFYASAIVLHEMTYHSSSFLYCSREIRIRICSSHCRMAFEYLTSAWVVLPYQQNITENLVILFMLLF